MLKLWKNFFWNLLYALWNDINICSIDGFLFKVSPATILYNNKKPTLLQKPDVIYVMNAISIIVKWHPLEFCITLL